ncbi:MAG: hypothetical protein HY017_13245 [Betaproteobacteria bacterium]|nr:hypothetical protein [Betaproteobacteria bacterium]
MFSVDIEGTVEALPVRQGDIFIWRGQETNDPWKQFGIVVTADCDIAQSKTHNSLSYVPLLPLRHYIEAFWAVQRLKRTIEQRTGDAIALVHRHHAVANASAKRITTEAFHRWIRSTSADEICNGLGISDEKERRKFSEKHYKILKKLIDYFDAPKATSALSVLCDVRFLGNADKPEKVVEQAVDDLTDRLPQDCFLISGIPEHHETKGLVAMLRYVRAMDEDDITSSLAVFRDGTPHALRVCRLTSPFKFALMQQFALLFTRVGLPDSHDEHLEQVVKLVCDEMLSEVTRGLK